MSNIITKKKGFTLVEVVVVIAIMAMLMSLAVVTINIVRRQSRNAKLRDDARTIAAGLEAYYAANKKYPMFKNATNTGNKCTGSWYYRIDAYNLVNGPTYVGGALQELAPHIPDPKPTNTSSGGMICYEGNAPYSCTDPKEYYLWVVPEDKAAEGYKCGGWDGAGYCTDNSKCGYQSFGGLGEGNVIHCPAGGPSCSQ